MINVGTKPITRRIAIACGTIAVGPAAYVRINDRSLSKGDPLTLCQLAGIQGAKATSQTMILCHPLPLDHVTLRVEPDPRAYAITVYCTVETCAKTGVEMEALAGVNAALLNIWDIAKTVEPALEIKNVHLLAKAGGKTGTWLHPTGTPSWVSDIVAPALPQTLSGRSAYVITLSDRAAAGIYDDESGRILSRTLTAAGAQIVGQDVIPDEPDYLRQLIHDVVERHAPHLIICTGGTGVAERDVTPETLASLFDRVIPGIGEKLRADGAQYTPLSWSSRAISGLIGKTIVVALPGSPKAVTEGLSALLPDLLPHLIRIANGDAK